MSYTSHDRSKRPYIGQKNQNKEEDGDIQPYAHLGVMIGEVVSTRTEYEDVRLMSSFSIKIAKLRAWLATARRSVALANLSATSLEKKARATKQTACKVITVGLVKLWAIRRSQMQNTMRKVILYLPEVVEPFCLTMAPYSQGKRGQKIGRKIIVTIKRARFKGAPTRVKSKNR